MVVLEESLNETQKSNNKANSFTSAEGCAVHKGLVSKHTEWEVCLGF
jgi:hypothetical protein